MARPPMRPIKRLLIANRCVGTPFCKKDSTLIHIRGEIATRIIATARELDIESWVLYISGDSSHATGAAHAIELPSASSFMNIHTLIDIVNTNQIDTVHPGYGFLSESAEFAQRM